MKLDNFHVAFIQLETKAGAALERCLREAAGLALNQDECVQFTHNATRYAIHPNALLSAIEREMKAPRDGKDKS